MEFAKATQSPKEVNQYLIDVRIFFHIGDFTLVAMPQVTLQSYLVLLHFGDKGGRGREGTCRRSSRAKRMTRRGSVTAVSVGCSLPPGAGGEIYSYF